MSFTVGGSTPQLTFADATVQNTAALPLTGGSVSADITVNGLTVGRGAGSVSTNTAVGASALATNSTGSNNTAVGYQAGYSNTTGIGFTAIGYQSLYNTTGSNSTAVGIYSLKGSTTGTNVAMGYSALSTSTTGTAGTAIGTNALQANTTGSYNTALGDSALYSNTTASNNTAVGYQAGYGNTVGTSNTFLGYQAGYTNASGSANTFIGYSAGGTSAVVSATAGNTCIGAVTGYSLTTGTYNTFVGFGSSVGGVGAGYYVTTGIKNTILGGYNGNQNGLDIRTSSNYIVLSDGDGNPRGYFDNNGSFLVGSFNARNGANIYYPNYDVVNAFTAQAAGNSRSLYTGWYSASTTSSGTLSFNVTSNGNVLNTNNSYGSLSDVKLKENITNATPKLEQLCQVRVVNYNLKEGQTQKQLGVIAQELETVFPSMIEETPDRDVEGNDLGTTTKSVKYSVFVPMLIKAVQELKAEFDAYKATHP